MLLATASIGRKLLLSFIAMAMLVMLSALIGVSGFSLVAKTERNVVDAAIPAMIEARQVSELSTRIISSVQMLSNAQNEQERKEAGRVLFEQLESLLTHIKELGGESFDSKLLDALESNVQNVINNLAELGVTVERKLWLAKEIDTRVEEMRLLSEELEQLTRTQVQNTSTIAVANVTHIYDLLEANKKDQVYQALDALVEVDLDLTERLHELHLLAFKMLNQIEEARTLTNVDRIQQIQTAFENNLKIMKRRVLAVEDPTRSKQMSQLLTELGKRQVVFTILLQQYENNEQSQQLMQKTLELFSELNSTVNKLVDDSNKTTTFAVDQLTNTLKFAQWSLTVISIVGLIVVVLILWRVVYVSVVKRLAEYSAALLSVAQGNLAVELEVKGKDELAHMGQAIITARNTAQALKVVAEGEAKAKRELEEHKEHLEELIEQRTSQLRQANLRLNEEVVNHAQARNEAEQASRAKSAFLATMSHEIRTPMNGVLGTARLLMDSGLNPIQKRYAEIINRSGKTLLAILNDVLDYSKIEAGHLEIRRLGFDLHQMVEDTFQLMNSRAQEKQLLFSYHIESDVSRYWKGDVTRISQVLNNLVGNAIKFTEDGEIDIYVSLNPEDESQVLFEVSDTGIGISKKDQKTLFDAFTQAEGGLNQIGGTGLGLAISKRIVEAMGGVLEVDSEEGEGSRFWFSIPLEESEPVEIGVVASARCKVKAKVLLVEDNEVNRVVAEGFLQSMGHQVVMAEDGLQAERIIDKQDFDIALVDINLPDCDGTDLIQRLKRIERNKPGDKALSPTPMIAVSAHVFAEEVERYLAAGFDGYLPKPVEKEALATLIQDVLDGKQLLLPQSGECLPLSETSDTSLTIENQVEQDHQQREEPEMVIINPSVIQSDMKILGREKMLHIIDLFRNTSADVLGQLVESAEKNDSLAVKNLAHKLKGSAGSLGLTALMNTCQSIEIAAEPLDTYNAQQGLLDEQVATSVNALDELMAE
ncbi:TPA: TMAO reductase system sensor histidine kinase/response regulator TorS [Vibrio parahaemolyticus]|uniref:TMAO reductase system sensor histidine kinase/response regulator TorS n=1 Tax=Vibrio parahaemolyticus TaxID=670 RepID=UPI0011239F1B|nr:TMAO reductase system sensor histidine kinase/response regulator TorS [Vibrio parahaemolyticus]EGQ9917826.1 TMAO reductase system sensor histidine kinase/response regulator TorS [Vibrio parahaemolyticus]MDF4541624.1 TMAO reductase system sensor histidine kinase/response regulator TorS [Vibrio parahaemolyticus]MDF4564673.1 TMAO reductase system sensor histidine kinase/response regulator TorS [Vibrio parahaemolyticus]MDF5381115.1 TMAO reductase system sensor histidine kinase/response regulator